MGAHPSGCQCRGMYGWGCAQERAVTVCECPPCPGRGYDGHRMNHCAECCFGSGVEADIDCPTHGSPARPVPPTDQQKESNDE